jgi:LacI family transcriptional regulator
MTSLREVAELAGVAVGTVSNFLNHPERVSPQRRVKVQKAIDELGFVRNETARQLRAGQSRVIGLVVLDAANPFFAELAVAAEEEAISNGYVVIQGNSNHAAQRELHYTELFAELRVQGVLISPVEEVPRQLKQLEQHGTGVVLVDREADASERCSVSVDDVAGGYLAARHLLEGGRRSLAFMGGPFTIRQVADRFRGASKAVSEFSDAAIEVIHTESLDILSGRKAGQLLMQRAPERRPDAIFAANDLVAVGAVQALAIEGQLSIPEDIALIGYDDIDFASASVVPLSSVRQPAALLGRTAVRMVIDEGQPGHKHRHVLFQPELIIRNSSGPNRRHTEPGLAQQTDLAGSAS